MSLHQVHKNCLASRAAQEIVKNLFGDRFSGRHPGSQMVRARPVPAERVSDDMASRLMGECKFRRVAVYRRKQPRAVGTENLAIHFQNGR